MKSLYLLVNIGAIIFPLALSFDKKVAFYKKWKYLFTSTTLVAIFFLIWDYFFTAWGVWSFNEEYITGIKLLNLPLEEVLFFFTIPYACVFIYECILAYIAKDYLKKWALPITIAIMVLAAVVLLFNYGKLYTATTLILLGAYMMQLLVVNRAQWLGRFYLAYAIALVPFLIVNGILTAKPVVIYNNLENLGIRIGSIPVEDTLYMMLLLLMNVAIYERLQKRFVKKEDEPQEPQPISEPVQI